MPLTYANWLAVLEPKLTEPLFHSEVVGRLHQLARTLPGECQGTLEVRLAADASPVDLSLRLFTAAQACDMAARFPSFPAAEFLARWSDTEGSLAPVRSVWLEFDLDREETPGPVICAKLPADLDVGWLVGTLLPALQGRSLSGGQNALILA